MEPNLSWILLFVSAALIVGLAGTWRKRRSALLTGLGLAFTALGLALGGGAGWAATGLGLALIVWAVVAPRPRASSRALELSVDERGRLVRSRNLEALLGWVTEEVHGEPFAGLIYPEDRPLWEKVQEQVLETGEATTLELRAVHAAGRLVWLRVFVEPRTEGLRLEAFEVTPYKLAEQTLRRQERLLKGVSDATRTMLAAKDDLAWPLNKAMATLAMSLGAERAYLYKVEDHPETGRRRASLQVEWVRDVLKTRIDSPLSGELVENDPRFARWFRELEHGQVIAGPVAQLPGEERLMLEASGVGSILLLPLLIGGAFWGFAGFELTETNRRFGHEMIRVLRTAAASLAAGIERVERTRELSVQRSLLERINEAAGDGILAVDAQWRPLFYNRRFLEIWGLSAEELSAEGSAGLSVLTRRTKNPKRFAEVLLELHERPDRNVHIELRLKDGRILQASSAPLDGGETGGRVWFMRDVTEARRLEQALARSEERFRTILQNTSDITAVLDEEMRIRYISPAVEAVLGHKVRDLVGLTVGESIHPDDRPAAERSLRAALEDPSRPIHVTFRIRSASGETRWLEVRGRNLLANPAVRGILVSARDITEHKVYEAQIEHMAYYDALTGLANRRMLRERVEEAIRELGGGGGFAFVYIDLDRFKNVNDTLGHDIGDALLVQVARRLEEQTGPGDVLARLGGDEFGLLARRDDQEGVLELAQRLIQALRPPFNVEGHHIHVSGSAGIALYPTDGETFEQLLRHADIAMYRAKDDKVHLQFYSPHLNVYTHERFQLETDLRTAMQSGSLILYYQPIQNVQGEMRGLEALVRWEHPTRGQIFPEEFLPLIEEAGLATGFDRQILTQAVRQIARWRGAEPPVWVSVNVGYASLLDPGFLGFLEQLFKEEQVEPERLLIEVTETQASRDPEQTKRVLGHLKELGVQLALDDFGQGYSSLSYLSDFPIDLIKIDRAFISGVPFRTKDAGIVRMIVALASQLGIDVLAEGVETETQREWLQHVGVHYLQGYAISEALPPAELPFGEAS
ncbi:sensor domain-containing protein [Oceanithermus profundus]|uniref:Diguanylate cyclase/phosphodiesterase with PAS/PAC and GAF sensor(S) n=1 Tax=Oceanithermus profundus (strain DSM 14977 / NBRC 100410 / VKM B-2274 / 506) TaxID=670487 RepID=E4U5R8_OCEP5|nr:EAL domain-containing protein [Oceanithermus profundus]ADR35626.1 diguanylate cyclase/phosphodiesterase with PAS/PAC and GAF sensor(s) [Oceanithermus profundus DSM 14977]